MKMILQSKINLIQQVLNKPKSESCKLRISTLKLSAGLPNLVRLFL
jgi:hypothetical protein